MEQLSWFRVMHESQTSYALRGVVLQIKTKINSIKLKHYCLYSEEADIKPSFVVLDRTSERLVERFGHV